MFVSIVQLIALAFLGAFVSETLGCLWHRWVAHEGIFGRWFASTLRGRHFHHHEDHGGYPREALINREYHSSNETTFFPLAAMVIVGLLWSLGLGLLTWFSFASILGGSLTYAILGLSWMHTMYHADGRKVRDYWFLRIPLVHRYFIWLMKYHHVHHFKMANFAILNPLCDWVCGTYVSPSELPQLRAAWRNSQGADLFPNYVSRA